MRKAGAAWQVNSMYMLDGYAEVLGWQTPGWALVARQLVVAAWKLGHAAVQAVQGTRLVPPGK